MFKLYLILKFPYASMRMPSLKLFVGRGSDERSGYMNDSIHLHRIESTQNSSTQKAIDDYS